MTTVSEIVGFLEGYAPVRLAEDWDNVGLLVGDANAEVRRVMTCLTVTRAAAAEAVRRRADLVVAHHPLPFRPLKRLTAETTVGRLLLDLIAARVAVCSFHTAYDSAESGINQRLAEGIGLRGIVPLVGIADGLGPGRWGWLEGATRLADLAANIKDLLSIDRLQTVGDPDKSVRSVAVGCGAADELLDAARQQGCDAMLLGEARFHTCLEAEASDIALVLPGHFASERFAMEHLAAVIGLQFPGLEVWPSQDERDPIRWA
ncbi:MAG: Nif3-like dinuclear metal center hexameric protein [Pirellulales bacterium]|nr:Nif3-like dinuclear metal center hexameric protein [Pirellulales bacterium]